MAPFHELLYLLLICSIVFSQFSTPEPPACEPIIDVRVCANIGYRNTTFPNYANQTSLDQANIQLETFIPLINTECSNAIVYLLCAVYVPFCDVDFPAIRVKPCRNLCEYVREGCEYQLLQLGQVWPSSLECDGYPSIEDDPFCFTADLSLLVIPHINDLPQLPTKLILEEGDTLTLDCTPNDFQTLLVWKKNGNVLNLSNFTFEIKCALPSDTGIYSCSAFGITRQVQVYILPAYGGGIAIQYNNTYFPDSGVVNRFAVDAFPEVTLTCIATEGNGRLFWEATDDRLASILGTLRDMMESIANYSIVLEGVTITVDYPVPRDVIKLTISNVTVYSDTFRCSSERSHIFTSVFVTTGTMKENIVIQSVVDEESPYLAVHPSTPQSLVLGKKTTLAYIIAGDYETLMYFHNGTGIPQPRHSWTNPQLYEHTLATVSLRNAGNYTLAIGTLQQEVLQISLFVNLTIPSLDTRETLVTIREGESFKVSCIPSDDDVQLQWTLNREGEEESLNSYSHPEVDFIPVELRHTLRVNEALPLHEGSYLCSVALDNGSLVGPGNISVNVLRRCQSSYAAGVVWESAFEGDISSIRCREADPRFSLFVVMSRECGANGAWSDVDFSGCTLADDNVPPFLLLWLQLITLDTQADVDGAMLSAQLSESVTEVCGISVSWEEPVIYPKPYTTQPKLCHDGPNVNTTAMLFRATVDGSNASTIDIGEIQKYLEEMFLILGEFAVYHDFSDNDPKIHGFASSDICECGIEFASLQHLCTSTINPPCNCNHFTKSCKCVAPQFVGNGHQCTLDSDRDGYPNQALQSPDCIIQTDMPYCHQDTCPTVFNIPQEDDSPCRENQTGVCGMERDDQYQIQWGFTPAGDTSIQSCGVEIIGNATRLCKPDAKWSLPNVSQCQNRVIARIQERANEIFSNESTLTVNEMVVQSLMLLDDLSILTVPGTNQSILPRDLETANAVLSNTIDALSTILGQNGTSNLPESHVIVEVLSNILDGGNKQGWIDLQKMAVGSQRALNNAEKYGLYVAMALNDLGDEVVYSRKNLVIQGRNLNPMEANEILFPKAEDLVNFTSTNSSPRATILIPKELLQDDHGGANSGLPVANILFQSLGDFLPISPNRATAIPRSLVISSQVGIQKGELLQQNPLRLSFMIEHKDGDTDARFYCAFWNFSDPIGSGGFAVDGITTDAVTEAGENTFVQCSSTHLTSFAVLVDIHGAKIDDKPLKIVSYIGCGISIGFLSVSILFFLSLGKTLFTHLNNFIHVNLCIALFMGYLIFAVGIELAAESKVACTAVAALLHYFFLAAFCWMLCEGIMLFLMLVVVFSTLSKKWWLFLIIGWGIPFIFLAIGLATVLDEYGIKGDDGKLIYCWLSFGTDDHAIWTFVAPMLFIIVVNIVFLVLVLICVFKSCRGLGVEMKEKRKHIDLAMTTVKDTVILLPLLGLTWVFGLFAVNENTIVFAWLFTIFTSLQALCIFILHVLRNERVWGHIKKKYDVLQGKIQSQGSIRTAVKSAIKKDCSRVTSTEDAMELEDTLCSSVTVMSGCH